MRRTKSDPIQFRLMLDDYAVLERLAAETGLSPKDYVMDLTLRKVNTARRKGLTPTPKKDGQGIRAAGSRTTKIG